VVRSAIIRPMGAFPRLPALGCGLVAAVWGVLATAALAGPDDVVARVGGAEIRAREIEVVLKRLGLAEMAEAEQEQRAAAAVLEQIIDERVLRAELAAAGIEVPAAEVAAAVTRVREQVAGRGLEFEAFLAQTGRTPDTIRDQVALEIALDRYVSPRITPAAVAEAFDRNRRELDGTKLRVSHILLRPVSGGDDDPATVLLDEARTLRQEILRGRLSFGEAARRHSAGPSRRREGDIGWISREGPLLDAFASEVYSLAKGGVSEPFVTPFGVRDRRGAEPDREDAGQPAGPGARAPGAGPEPGRVRSRCAPLRSGHGGGSARQAAGRDR